MYEGYGALRSDTRWRPGADGGAARPGGVRGQYGYYTDTETGLLCLTHRYYDPGTGQFLNRDPAGTRAGSTSTGSPGTTPSTEQDPSGLYPGGESGRDIHTPSGYPGNNRAGYFRYIRGVPLLIPRYADLDYNIKAARAFSQQFQNYWAGLSTEKRGGLSGGGRVRNAKLDWLINHVATGQPWDYKQLSLKHPDLIPPGLSIQMRSQIDNFGNFNFGAVGAALGLSLDELQDGARKAHTIDWSKNLLAGKAEGSPWDDDYSTVVIKAGYDYYMNNYAQHRR